VSRRQDESILDPVTGRPRLCAWKCSTCVFRPGNLMYLRPGRLADLIEQNTGGDALGLICHKTLSYGDNPDPGGALCRGFYDGYGPLANGIRMF